MKTEFQTITEGDNHELVFSRVFVAPVELVYRAWTDPDQLQEWWGPRGFSLTITKMDLKIGGAWDYILRAPDGSEYPSQAIFEEINPPTRLVFLNTGGHISDKHLTCRMIVTFETQDAGTLVTLRMRFATPDQLRRAISRSAIGGGTDSFDQLAEQLSDCAGDMQSRAIRMAAN